MRGKTIFIADTLVHFRPNAEQLADIAIGAAAGGSVIWDTSRAWRCCRTRRSAIRSHAGERADARRGRDCWTSARWISNTTAK